MPADGYQVDLAALTHAANTSAAIARDAHPLVTDLKTTLDELASGAPGSESAAAAGSTTHQWTRALTNHSDRIQAIGDKLKQTADAYRRQDEAVAQTISKIAPAVAPEPARPSRISTILNGRRASS